MNNRKNGCYVYAYLDSRTEEPFYIGKGSGNRAAKHLQPSQQGDGPLRRYLQDLRHAGHNPVICIVKDNLTEKQALASEHDLIQLVGLSATGVGPLCNISLTKPGRKKGFPTRESVVGNPIVAWGQRFLSIAAVGRDPRCEVPERTLRSRIELGMRPEDAAMEGRVSHSRPCIEAFGEKFASLAALFRDPRCDISYITLQKRLKAGETPEQAIYRYRAKSPGRHTN